MQHDDNQPTAKDYIYGLRAIIEAIEAGKDIDRLLIKKDLQGDLATQLLELAKQHAIPMQRVPLERINRITRKNHQGALAYLSSVTYHRLDDIVPALYEEGRVPFLLILDGITDVRNFGAIARTAECCGVDAIIIPERGSVRVGPDAIKTSAGALLTLPVCREKNLVKTIDFLHDNGYTIVAVSEKANLNYTQAQYTVPTALVMGAEDTGISQPVLRKCDHYVSIPMFGEIGSLNVSVAAGVLMYEVVRQRLNENLEVI